MNPAPLVALARVLPRRAARPLGRAWGRLALGLSRSRRDLAIEKLGRAMPDLDADEATRLARRSFAHHFAGIADVAAIERLDPRRLCRHLSLAGWEHLAAAEGGGRGVLLLAPRLGLWRLAVLAIGLYRGPVTIAGSLAEDPLLGRLAARFERRLEQPVLATSTAEDAPGLLTNGGRVAVLVELATGEALAADDAARSALAAGVAVVPVLARPEPAGRYRIIVREPIDPDADFEALARRCRDAIAREVRHRPELAVWWR